MVLAQLADMKPGTRTDLASIDARSSQPENAGLLNVSRASMQRTREVAESACAENRRGPGWPRSYRQRRLFERRGPLITVTESALSSVQ